MMDKKSTVRIQTMHMFHILIYLFSLFLLSSLYLGDYKTSIKYIHFNILAEASIVMFSALLVMELLLFPLLLRIEQSNSKGNVVLKVIQITAAYLCYFAFRDEVRFGLGNFLILLFALELIYALDFSDALHRLVIYLGIFTPFIILFIPFHMDNNIVYEAFAGILLFAAVACIMEIFIIIWDGFERRIMEQNHVMDELNEVYEKLKEQHEEMNRTNEILGQQKLNLMEANKKIQASHKELMLQNSIANTASMSLEMEPLMKSLCEMILEKLNVNFVAIIVIKQKERRASDGDEKPSIAFLSTLGREFDRFVDEVFQTKAIEKVLRKDKFTMRRRIGKRPFYDEKMFRHIKSFVVMPLFHHKTHMGNVIIGSIDKNAFRGEQTFYETIAGQISMGVTNANLYQRMKEMAIRDGLTGIYNRRHLTIEMNRYAKEAKQCGKPLSLALFDIDHFKRINDTYGHLFGDDMIRFVAKVLNQMAKEYDGFAGRYGGEEFVLILAGKKMEEAYGITEKACDIIRSERILFEGKTVSLRVSAGISCYPETCDNPHDILRRADEAMYYSKQHGRNRITIDNDSIANQP